MNDGVVSFFEIQNTNVKFRNASLGKIEIQSQKFRWNNVINHCIARYVFFDD